MVTLDVDPPRVVLSEAALDELVAGLRARRAAGLHTLRLVGSPGLPWPWQTIADALGGAPPAWGLELHGPLHRPPPPWDRLLGGALVQRLTLRAGPPPTGAPAGAPEGPLTLDVEEALLPALGAGPWPAVRVLRVELAPVAPPGGWEGLWARLPGLERLVLGATCRRPPERPAAGWGFPVEVHVGPSAAVEALRPTLGADGRGVLVVVDGREQREAATQVAAALLSAFPEVRVRLRAGPGPPAKRMEVVIDS